MTIGRSERYRLVDPLGTPAFSFPIRNDEQPSGPEKRNGTNHFSRARPSVRSGYAEVGYIPYGTDLQLAIPKTLNRVKGCEPRRTPAVFTAHINVVSRKPAFCRNN
jgi:hypothetical protein